MMAGEWSYNELNELILKSLEGAISDEQFLRLDRLIAGDPLAADYYVKFMATHISLGQSTSLSCSVVRSEDAGIDMSLWEALAESERNAETVEIVKPVVDSNPNFKFSQKRKTVQLRRQFSKLSLITAFLSSAAMLFILLLVLLTPDQPPVVARLTDSVGVVWNDVELPTENGSELRAGNISLLDGYVEIEFDGGAVVVIESPAEFDLESDGQMFLWAGSVSSVVPERAKGFTVRTPNATVVDYGTEFGVVVDDDGRTEAHVFKGLVDLRTGPDPRVFDQSRKLTAGQGGFVDHEGQLSSRKFAADSKLFAREVPSSYEVAVVKSKAIAYWRFSKGHETFSNIMKRYAYRGNYFESVRFEESGPDLGGGKSCQAMKLDGSDGYALIENVKPVDVRTGSSSVAAWVRLDDKRGQNIVCTSYMPGPAWEHSSQLRTDNDGHLEFYTYAKDNGMHFVKSEKPFEIGRWYHLVGVVDKTEMSFYIDGKLVGTFEMSALQVDDYNHVNIGGWAGNWAGNQDVVSESHARKGLNGAVAEVSMYRRALNAQEIKAMYKAAKGSE